MHEIVIGNKEDCMWSRVELKNRAKEALKRNYWKAVLVGLLCIILGTSSGLELSFDADDIGVENNQLNFDFSQENLAEFDTIYMYSYGYDDSYEYDYDDYYEENFYDYDIYEDSFYEFQSPGINSVFQIAIRFMIIVIVVFVIGGAIGILLSTFILNPLEVGASRFFLKNLDKNAQIGELGFAFDTEYKNITKIMFFRNLYVVLWSLLFVIPGIIKSYEYQMIPYLLAENPSLTKEQAFAISKQMMDGHKWKAFVLDLSFFGWYLLSAFTLGLLSIFYVNPYEKLTCAALYQELSNQNGRPAFAMPNQQLHYEQWVVNEENDSQEYKEELFEADSTSYKQLDNDLDENKDSF